MGVQSFAESFAGVTLAPSDPNTDKDKGSSKGSKSSMSKEEVDKVHDRRFDD